MSSVGGYPVNPKYFKEAMICEKLTLEACMMDIQKVVEIISDPEVISVTLVETKKGLSNEGVKLTGYKVLIEIKVKQKVLYTNYEASPVVKGAHFESFASFYVVVPEQVDGVMICELFNRGQLRVNPYIEKVYGVKLDNRTIQECMLMFVDVEIVN